MAEWRQVAKVCALGDGHISKKEVEILPKGRVKPLPSGGGYKHSF